MILKKSGFPWRKFIFGVLFITALVLIFTACGSSAEAVPVAENNVSVEKAKLPPTYSDVVIFDVEFNGHEHIAFRFYDIDKKVTCWVMHQSQSGIDCKTDAELQGEVIP